MGLFTPVYLKKNLDLDPRRKQKALDRVKAIRDPEKLAAVIREASCTAVRVQAVRNLEDTGILTGIALDESERKREVREAAVRRLEQLGDGDALTKIAMETEDGGIGKQAAGAVEDGEKLIRICREAGMGPVRAAAVERIHDGETLKTAASDPYWGVREAALAKMSDPGILAHAALTDPDSSARGTAVRNPNLTDPEVLAEVAMNDCEPIVAESAVDGGKLTDPALLAKIALESRNVMARKAAVNRIDDPRVLAEVAGRMDGETHTVCWLAAVRLSRLDPGQAVAPLVRLMAADREKFIWKKELKEAVAFLKDQFLHSEDPEIRSAVKSLPSGWYGHNDNERCMHGDSSAHFDLYSR